MGCVNWDKGQVKESGRGQTGTILHESSVARPLRPPQQGGSGLPFQPPTTLKCPSGRLHVISSPRICGGRPSGGARRRIGGAALHLVTMLEVNGSSKYHLRRAQDDCFESLMIPGNLPQLKRKIFTPQTALGEFQSSVCALASRQRFTPPPLPTSWPQIVWNAIRASKLSSNGEAGRSTSVAMATGAPNAASSSFCCFICKMHN